MRGPWDAHSAHQGWQGTRQDSKRVTGNSSFSSALKVTRNELGTRGRVTFPTFDPVHPWSTPAPWLNRRRRGGGKEGYHGTQSRRSYYRALRCAAPPANALPSALSAPNAASVGTVRVCFLAGKQRAMADGAVVGAPVLSRAPRGPPRRFEFPRGAQPGLARGEARASSHILPTFRRLSRGLPTRAALSKWLATEPKAPPSPLRPATGGWR